MLLPKIGSKMERLSYGPSGLPIRLDLRMIQTVYECVCRKIKQNKFFQILKYKLHILYKNIGNILMS
jgi:hypothetical protein